MCLAGLGPRHNGLKGEKNEKEVGAGGVGVEMSGGLGCGGGDQSVFGEHNI